MKICGPCGRKESREIEVKVIRFDGNEHLACEICATYLDSELPRSYFQTDDQFLNQPKVEILR